MSLFRRRFAPQGAVPGQVAASEGHPSRITIISYNETELEEFKVETAEQAHAHLRAGRNTWIDISGLGDAALIQEIGERFKLDALAVSDVINVGQRPKLDDYPNHLFIVLRQVTVTPENELVWEQVSLFLGPDFVISFQETYDDCLDPIRTRLRGGRRQIRGNGSDYLFTMIIDAIVDGYFPVLEAFADQLERYENEILSDRGNEIFGELYRTKRDLASFRRAALPLRDAMSSLLKDDQDWLTEAMFPYVRDTLDHTMQVVDVTESYRELAVSLVDVHLSMVGQRTNEVMRVLTVISAIFIPLTFIAGVYGMNFNTEVSDYNLPELSFRYGYPMFWALCIVMGLTLVFVFRRLGWLKG